MQGTYAVQVALGFQYVGRILAELGACFVRLGAVLTLVDNEKCLVFSHVRAFLKLHALQEAFHTGTYLYELLCTDAAHVFPIDFHVFHAHRLHDNQRSFRFYFLRPRQDHIKAYDDHQADRHDDEPLLAQVQFSFRKKQFHTFCAMFFCSSIWVSLHTIFIPLAKIMPFSQL